MKTLKVTLRVAWLVVTVLAVADAAIILGLGFGGEPDMHARCAGTARASCFSREPAVVTKATDPIHVAYEDGLRSTTIQLRGNAGSLRAGSRVWLERWDGDIVAISDRVTERRYRSTDWVDRWSGWTFWAPVLYLTVALVLSGLSARGFAVRRRRSRGALAEGAAQMGAAGIEPATLACEPGLSRASARAPRPRLDLLALQRLFDQGPSLPSIPTG
jgi:hypothetical protein